jgi:predicted HTH domain antitoxin
MKLEIEVNVAADAADKTELQEHLRKEAILALFADRKITAGKAAHELGLERLTFMELLKQRASPTSSTLPRIGKRTPGPSMN